MKKLIIGFSRPKKLNALSWLIMKIEQTEYSHVYMKFRSESLNRELIYQASGLQINFIGSQLFNDHHETVKSFEIEIDEAAYTKTLQTMVDKAGLPYSLKQLFLILGYIITGKILFKPDERHGYICAEAIAELLETDFDLDLVRPKDIELWLSLRQSKT